MREQKFLSDLGKRIAAARRQKGISQEKLVDAVDVHRTYIGFVEQGKRNPSIGKLRRIAKAVGLPLDKLFKGL